MTGARSLAWEIAEIQRRLAAIERGSQLSRSSLTIEGDTVTIPQTVRQSRVAVEKSTVALATADGKNTVTYSLEMPEGDGKAEGDTWFQRDKETGVIVGSWEWVDGNWDPRFFGDAVLNSLTVGKLVSGEIAAGVRVVAGETAGTRAELTSTGFRVFVADDAGVASEVIRLGASTEDFFAVTDSNGELSASIDQYGQASFSSLRTGTWPQVDAGDHTGRGGSMLEILDRRPRGMVAHGTSTTRFETNTTAGIGAFEISARLFEGRMYKLHMRGRIDASTLDNLAEVQLRYTRASAGAETTPARPTLSSPVAARSDTAVPRFEAQSILINKLLTLGPGSSFRNYRFLLSMSRVVGTGTLALVGEVPDETEMWIEDVGPYVASASRQNDGSGSAGDPAEQRFSKTWAASWARTYSASNAAAFDGQIHQGNNGAGTYKALVGFPSSIASELSGATIESIGLYLYAEHWFYSDGGIAVIGRHGHSSAPGTYGAPVAEDITQSPPNASSALWPRPGGRWVDLMPFAPQEWTTGATKGVVLGSSGMSGANRYYGRFAGPGTGAPPLINITYRK